MALLAKVTAAGLLTLSALCCPVPAPGESFQNLVMVELQGTARTVLEHRDSRQAPLLPGAFHRQNFQRSSNTECLKPCTLVLTSDIGAAASPQLLNLQGLLYNKAEPGNNQKLPEETNKELLVL